MLYVRPSSCELTNISMVCGYTYTYIFNFQVKAWLLLSLLVRATARDANFKPCHAKVTPHLTHGPVVFMPYLIDIPGKFKSVLFPISI